MGVLIQIHLERGPDSFVQAMKNLHENLSEKEVSKVVKEGWKLIRQDIVNDYRKLLPKRKKKYPLSHINNWKYGRARGTLRKSVKGYMARRVPKGLLPSLHFRVDNYPLGFLYGTDDRENTSTDPARSTGSIRNIMEDNDYYFENSLLPDYMDRFTNHLLSSKNFRDPFNKH